MLIVGIASRCQSTGRACSLSCDMYISLKAGLFCFSHFKAVSTTYLRTRKSLEESFLPNLQTLMNSISCGSLGKIVQAHSLLGEKLRSGHLMLFRRV